MSTLLCFGFGYSAQHYVAAFGGRFSRIVGTTRSAERAAALAGRDFGGRCVEMLVFGGVAPSRAIMAATGQSFYELYRRSRYCPSAVLALLLRQD